MSIMNFILETANAPGTSATFNLLGAATDRLPFLSASTFASGATAFFFMDDDIQAQWGYGYATTGSPNTFTISTVLGNTAGNTSRLNFTGTVRIFNEIPAERAIYADPATNLLLLRADPGVALGAATKQYVDASIGAINGGRLLNVQVFATAGTFTYTPTTGTNSVIVDVIGGGGGSGGCANTGVGQVSCTTGSSGGGLARSRITSAFSGVTVTVGAGGTAGALGGAGGAGGSSSFGALLSATGGGSSSGGAATTAGALIISGNAGLGGIGAGGNIVNQRGSRGTITMLLGSPPVAGVGGDAGGSGAGGYAGSPGGGASGVNQQAASSAGSVGIVGMQGLVVVCEYA